MHRHGYQGRKLGRERDQRAALIKGLLESLIIYESIETTESKAKELRPHIEKLITKAKKGDLHNRRTVISSLSTLEAAHKLVDDIAPRFSDRSSGFVRIQRTRVRRGDSTQMAKISFVEGTVPKKSPATKSSEKDAKPQKAQAKSTAKERS